MIVSNSRYDSRKAMLLEKNMGRPKSPEKKERMSLYLTPTLKSELEELAKSKSRTISNMVEVLIIEAITQEKSGNKFKSENFSNSIAA